LAAQSSHIANRPSFIFTDSEFSANIASSKQDQKRSTAEAQRAQRKNLIFAGPVAQQTINQ